ncbi:glycoside hydrolase family 13 protein [Trametopsis cervina]|nr:glycoside hydrolase family 13 protein [Trametopsis cervina]
MLKSFLASSLLIAPALAATAAQWQNRTIYQLVTDRFATTDGSSPQCDTSNRKYCGGTWKGITNKLDYIQNMGFDAVWISPVVKNIEGETAYGEAFHGYWTEDITQLNSNFGTADDLKALSKALHDRGMYLMVDVVVNHVAASSNPPNFGVYNPFNAQSDFHAENFIQPGDYFNNQTAVEQGWLGDTNVPLADLNTEDPNIVKTWNTWIGGLVQNYSIDGVRIDTVKHVRKDFWPDFAKSANAFTIGEVLDNRTTYVSDYTQVIDAVLDYPDWYPLTSGFVSTSGNLSALAETVQQSQSSYKNGAFGTGSFLENHDQPRLGSQTQDQSLIMNAMAWPFVSDGIPILYYGQEQGYTGGADPANREALWLSGYGTDKPLVQHVEALTTARQTAAKANSNFLSTKVQFLTASPSSLVISKPPLVALLTNQGSQSTPTWSVSNAGFTANEEVWDVLTCTKYTTDSNGALSVTGSGGKPQILLPTSALSAAGRSCPSFVTTGKQASSATKPASLIISVGAAASAAYVIARLLL